MKNYLYDENIARYDTYNSLQWWKKCSLRVEKVDNGVITTQAENSLLVYTFGVVRPDKTFVSISGMYRQDKEMVPDDFVVKTKPVRTEHKTVVYLGPIWTHYGHWLMELCSRLWYAVKNKNDNVYYAFAPRDSIFTFSKWMLDFLSLFGIKESQLLLIREPTQFDTVIVPEFSTILGKYYTSEYVSIFKHIADQIPAASGYDKVYFSRKQFTGNMNTIGEETIEECFRKNGFQIVYPETLDFKTQISIIRGCNVFAALNGSACHNLLFSNGNCDVFILNRFDTPNWAQFIVDEIAGRKTCYIDSYFGFLPVSHGGGPFLVGPNANLSQCLMENFGIETNYNKEPNFSDAQIMLYLSKWFNMYSNPRQFAYLKNANTRLFNQRTGFL